MGRAGASSWVGTRTGSLAFGTRSFWVYFPPPGKLRSSEPPSRLLVPSQVRADTEAEWGEGGLEVGRDSKDFSPNISLNSPNRPLSWRGNTEVIPILQMRRLRHGEVKELRQRDSVRKQGSQDQNPGARMPDLGSVLGDLGPLTDLGEPRLPHLLRE